MTDRAQSLAHSISTIVRALKVTEATVQTAHGELKASPSDLFALRFIDEHPDCMSSALAQDLGVAATTATSIVDRLVARGFVQRRRIEENRRVVSLSLTAEGREAVARINAEDLEKSEFMLSVMTEAEQEVVVEVMARVAQAYLDQRD